VNPVSTTLIFVLCISLILISLTFATHIETALYLKPNLTKIGANAFEIHFIDVGQGDAVAIRFPNNKTMLIDAGPNYSQDNLKEYLDKVFFNDGYNTFDYVFLSHSDIDHSANIKFILNNYRVRNFCRPPILSASLEENRPGYGIDDNEVYDEIILTLEERNITTFFATNANIDTGAGLIEMYLNPVINYETETNESSYVIVVKSNNSIAYFGGDLGEDSESDIMAWYNLPDVDLLKLSHHGSKYSNSYELLVCIKPEYVACCVGENSYGHPASDTLLRLAQYDEDYGKTTYDTLKSTLHNGNIVYYVNNYGEEVDVLTIENIGDFVFVDWYVIVIVSCVALTGLYVLYIFTGKFKIEIKIKNMKR